MLLWSWVAIGAFAGVIAGQIAHRSGAAAARAVLVSVAGAITGGWLFEAWAPQDFAESVLLGNLMPSAVGAAIFLVAYFAIARRVGTSVA